MIGLGIGVGLALAACGPVKESVTISQYDDKGNVTYYYDAHNDGKIDSVTTSKEPSKIPFDLDGDGVHDGIKFLLDASGRKVKEIHDLDQNGIVEHTSSYSYDTEGRLSKALHDDLGDGSVESMTRWQYQGTLTKKTFHQDCDKRPDCASSPYWAATYLFDSNGNIIRTEIDKEADGVVDQISFRQYDERGNVTLATEDSDADGKIDSDGLRQRYDSQGNLVESITFNTSDNTPKYSLRWKYDEKGRTVMKFWKKH